MSPTANCPNCGAPIRFRWSSAVQTVCEFCHSILVRRDVNLELVGKVADLPPDSSPIQIATEALPLAGQVTVGWIHEPWMQLKALVERAT